MTQVEFLASLNLGQFRAFRKAVATLTRIGINRVDAIEMVIHAMQQRDSYRVPHAVSAR